MTSLYTDYFNKIKEKANQRLQCIKHWGFHKDGLRPETALKLYKLLIRPILEYGAQVLIYDHYYLKPNLIANTSLDRKADFVKQLEQFQTQAIKYLLGCPKSTSPVIVRLFSGIEPLSSRFDLLKLRYFWRISHGDVNNIALKVYKKRRKNFHFWSKARPTISRLRGTNDSFLFETITFTTTRTLHNSTYSQSFPSSNNPNLL